MVVRHITGQSALPQNQVVELDQLENNLEEFESQVPTLMEHAATRIRENLCATSSESAWHRAFVRATRASDSAHRDRSGPLAGVCCRPLSRSLRRAWYSQARRPDACRSTN